MPSSVRSFEEARKVEERLLGGIAFHTAVGSYLYSSSVDPKESPGSIVIVIQNINNQPNGLVFIINYEESGGVDYTLDLPDSFAQQHKKVLKKKIETTDDDGISFSNFDVSDCTEQQIIDVMAGYAEHLLAAAS